LASTIRPTGDRVLIAPHPKRTEVNGLAIVEDYQPDCGGVVVALGDGPESRKRAVQRFADSVIDAISDEPGYYDPDALNYVRAVIMKLRDDYQPEHVCAVGDEVTFSDMAGAELDIGDDLYLLVREDDLQTILVKEPA
jgi:co-chaperonin GroES (HSP10)